MNFADDDDEDDDDEKRLVGLRLAAPQAKIAFKECEELFLILIYEQKQ